MDVQDATLQCLRCKGAMAFDANRQLEDDSFMNMFNSRMYITVMRCGNCGHLEMFDEDTLSAYLNRPAPARAPYTGPQTIPLATGDLED